MRLVSFILLLAGLFLAIYCFFELSVAALPYQDPTTEMLKTQTERATFWQYLVLESAFAAIFGGLGLWRSGHHRKFRDVFESGTAM